MPDQQLDAGKDDVKGEAAESADGSGSFRRRRRCDGRPPEQPPKSLPPSLSGRAPPRARARLALLTLALSSLGLSLHLLLRPALASANPAIACLLLGLGICGYLLLVVPLVHRTVKSTAAKNRLALPDATWLQTLAMLGVPTLAAVFAYFNAGVVAAVCTAVAGLAVTTALMMFIYGARPVDTLFAALWTNIVCAIGSVVTLGLLAAMALLLLRTGFVMPWDARHRPPASASSSPAAAAGLPRSVHGVSMPLAVPRIVDTVRAYPPVMAHAAKTIARPATRPTKAAELATAPREVPAKTDKPRLFDIPDVGAADGDSGADAAGAPAPATQSGG